MRKEAKAPLPDISVKQCCKTIGPFVALYGICRASFMTKKGLSQMRKCTCNSP